MNILNIAFALLSYLFGSIPTGYLLVKHSEKKDIRDFGSRATGATNVLRMKGWKSAILVLAIDILKGALPVFLALKILPDRNVAFLCGFLTILGHCYPVYIKFKGGKGVATTLGVFAVTAYQPLLIVLIIFLILVILTRYVSLGSILGVFCYPIILYLFHREAASGLFSMAISLLVIFKHKENIKRLFAGNERKLGEKVT